MVSTFAAISACDGVVPVKSDNMVITSAILFSILTVIVLRVEAHVVIAVFSASEQVKLVVSVFEMLDVRFLMVSLLPIISTSFSDMYRQFLVIAVASAVHEVNSLVFVPVALVSTPGSLSFALVSLVAVLRAEVIFVFALLIFSVDA